MTIPTAIVDNFEDAVPALRRARLDRRLARLGLQARHQTPKQTDRRELDARLARLGIVGSARATAAPTRDGRMLEDAKAEAAAGFRAQQVAAAKTGRLVRRFVPPAIRVR